MGALAGRLLWEDFADSQTMTVHTTADWCVFMCFCSPLPVCVLMLCVVPGLPSVPGRLRAAFLVQTGCSRLIWSVPALLSARFPGAPVSFHGKWDLETSTWVLAVLTAVRVPPVLVPSQRRATQVYSNTAHAEVFGADRPSKCL